VTVKRQLCYACVRTETQVKGSTANWRSFMATPTTSWSGTWSGSTRRSSRLERWPKGYAKSSRWYAVARAWRV